MKNHSNGNKDSSKERNETPRQATEKDSSLISRFGLACLPPKLGGQTGLPASPAIPRPSSSGVGLGRSSTIAYDRTEPRPVENSGLLKYDLILEWAMRDEEMKAPGSLHTSHHGDRNSSPHISQEWTYYSPLPLPRVWQAQAHVPTCYLLLFFCS